MYLIKFLVTSLEWKREYRFFLLISWKKVGSMDHYLKKLVFLTCQTFHLLDLCSLQNTVHTSFYLTPQWACEVGRADVTSLLQMGSMVLRETEWSVAAQSVTGSAPALPCPGQWASLRQSNLLSTSLPYMAPFQTGHTREMDFYFDLQGPSCHFTLSGIFWVFGICGCKEEPSLGLHSLMLAHTT